MIEEDSDRFFKIRHPEIKLGKHTISEEITKIKFLEGGEDRSLSPIELEYKEIWENDGCKVILIELFYQSLDHNELLDRFSEKMSMIQRYRAQKKAMQYHTDPDRFIKQDEFTFYNPYNPESFLYKYLSLLKAYGLVKKVAQVIATRNIYYSLTSLGKKKVIEWLISKYQNEYIVFLSLLPHYNRDDDFLENFNSSPSFPALYVMMRWIEESQSVINNLIVCFTKPLQLSSLQDIYEDYLLTMRYESKEEVKKRSKNIESEIIAKLNNLFSLKIITFDKENQTYDLTEKGMNEVRNIYENFQSAIFEMENDHLVTIQYYSREKSVFQSSLLLTSNGKIIAEKMREHISKDENLIMTLDLSHKGKFLLPINDEMKRLKKIQYNARKIQLIIPRKKRKGLKYKVMNAITHHIFLSFLLVVGISIIFFSMMNHFYHPTFIAIAIISLIMSPTLMIIRERWKSLDQQIQYDFQMKRRLL